MSRFKPTAQTRVSEKTVLKLAHEMDVELFEHDLLGLDRRSEATVVRALGVIKSGKRGFPKSPESARMVPINWKAGKRIGGRR